MYEFMPEWRGQGIDALVGNCHRGEYDDQHDPDRFRARPPHDQHPCSVCDRANCNCELGGEG